jgi:hypothetical protein
MRLRVLVVGLAAVAVAGLVALAGPLLGFRPEGPLGPYGGAGVIWRAGINEAFTWAMPLPDNPTTADIRIDSIAPVGTEGLELLGVLVSYDGCGILSISNGFPPPGVSAADPEGGLLEAMSEPCALHVLIGVRRVQGSESGMIDGLRMAYRVDGRAYEVLLPWSLEVPDPSPEP